MDVKEYLRAEIDRKLAEAESITEAAAKAARSVTPDEKKTIEDLISDATEKKNRVVEIEENEQLQKSIEQMRGPVNQPAHEAPAGAKTLGEAFVKSDSFQALQAGFKSGALTGKWTSGAVELPFDAKATVTSTASPIIQPDVQGGLQPLLMRRLTIADLLASGTTDSNVIRYVREATNTNAAATVAEGGLKPESTITFDQVDEPVRKIATFLPVSDEMLEDVAQLRSYLDGRLRLFVQHAEEAQLLSGDGTGTNLTGLLNRTGVQTIAVAAPAAGVTNPSAADYLYDAITNIRVNALVEPDGIVMHPTNWSDVRTAKDDNGQYYGGGPFTGPYGNGGISRDNIWGLPVVVTSAIPVNTALVGAFQSQAQAFRRGGLTVEASNSHADFFQHNLTAIRAEERLGLAVYRPAAFHTITGLNNAGATG